LNQLLYQFFFYFRSKELITKQFMRLTYAVLLLLIARPIFGQGIVIDTTTYSIPDLVKLELTPNSCTNETNFQFSSKQSIGMFTNTNPNFPIQKGVIIRNGLAKYSEGTYSGQNLNSQINSNGDAYLQNLSNSSGQNTAITDVAFLQYDFVPISNTFSFDFLFASNEYGEYQCGFSDVFAFVLTNLTTGVTTNLAVIPNTSTPVSVKNIRDSAYNTSCVSQNPSFFDTYNFNSPATSATNMRGQTVLMTAFSSVTPNQNYRIRMSIGDYNDSNFDSAVFLASGNFSVGSSLGVNRVICEGQTILLNSNLSSNFQIEWSKDGTPIAGQTGSTLTVSEPGTYSFTAGLSNTNCVISDEVVLSTLQITPPPNISTCDTGASSYTFNLTENDAESLDLDASAYSLLYFASLQDAIANSPSIPSSQLNAYQSSGNQTIYIKVVQNSGGVICDDLISFNLEVTTGLTAGVPQDLLLCTGTSGTIVRNLNDFSPIVLNGLDPNDYTVTYHSTENGALTSTDLIQNPSNFTFSVANNPYIIWIRLENNSNSFCFDVVSFTIEVYFTPPVDTLGMLIGCSSVVLPPLTNGNYYTGQNGTGTMLNAGDVIVNSSTIYIYNNPLTFNGCDNQSSVTIVIVEEADIDPIGCAVYNVPDLPAGEFYTLPNATGTLLPPGTELTTNQTIYYHAIVENVFCIEIPIAVEIYPLPPVDTMADVITCDSYVLPTPINGEYYIDNETGATLTPGSEIFESTDLTLIATSQFCTNQSEFSVTIIDGDFFDLPVVSCGSYMLPDFGVGNYYTQPGGQGTQITPGTTITTSRTLYFYVQTTTFPNCTQNFDLEITINPVPPVDTPSFVSSCGNYTLPPLTNGTYYSLSNGLGSILFPGDIITSTKTIYIYATNSTCSNEHSLLIQVNPKPPVDNFTDVFVCDPTFTLPALTNGQYYTESGGPAGGGTILQPGTVLNTSQTLYIYNPSTLVANCYNESVFTISINYIDLGAIVPVFACDSYTLPALTVGNYYTEPLGQGTLIPFGTVLTATQTIYVYAQIGNRLNCAAEASFLVTISQTPALPSFANVNRCGNYVLPALTEGNYYTGSNGAGTLLTAGTSIISTQTVYVFATAPDNVNCFDEKSFVVTIVPLNDFPFEPGTICVDLTTGDLISPHIFTTGLNPTVFTVEWFLNGTLVGVGPTYTATQDGTYTVEFTKNTPNTGTNCGYNTTTVIVEKSSIAAGFLTVIDDFYESVDITVTITGGFGDYVFQLDDGPVQGSPVFSNVDSGDHIVSIIDTKGDCGILQLNANVLKYPKFFTPNNDSYNDTWNIVDLANQQEAVIFIYDRYGKLIKQISPSGFGWDGTYNGQPLPSTDYWFEVRYTKEDKANIFKSHFSLKR
jgi:gliding motility-associated-like protein